MEVVSLKVLDYQSRFNEPQSRSESSTASHLRTCLSGDRIHGIVAPTRWPEKIDALENLFGSPSKYKLRLGFELVSGEHAALDPHQQLQNPL